MLEFKEAADTLHRKGHKIYSVVGPKGFQVTVDDIYNYTGKELSFLVKNGLTPGTKLWSRAALDSDIPDIQANQLMSLVVKAYQGANLPEGVEIYRAEAVGGHVLYFSPEAASLIPDGFHTTPCLKPDVTKMKRQRF